MGEIETGVEVEQRGRLGLITLDRPKALNALSLGMIEMIGAMLARWAGDPAVAVVAIRGRGRAFCAGGDIRAMWETGRAGGEAQLATLGFYAAEYRLNAAVRAFPKPYVALLDGIVMGGGVGISVHGDRRIAGEGIRLAMPETGIGFIPDVGTSHVLPRLEGEVGMWMALTGARLGQVDAVRSGLCDHAMPSERFEELIEALARLEIGAREPIEAVDWAIEAMARPPEGPSVLEEHRARIDRLFAGSSLEAVLAALGSDEHYWSGEQIEAIRSKCPMATKLTYRLMRDGAALGFEECLRLEYRLARTCMTRNDWYEGVRAAVIDKHGAPRWAPATLEAVEDAAVATAFEPLGPDELRL